MLAPREIINKRFDKGAFGYKTDDVDKYLSAIAEDYSKLVSERNEYEKNMTMLASKLEEYRKDENNLSAVLMGAQKLGDSIIKEAKNKAELIIRDAGIKSDKMLEGTHRQLEREKRELAKVQKEVTLFKAKILDIYKSHLELVSALPEIEESNYAELQGNPHAERQQYDEYHENSDSGMYMDQQQGYMSEETMSDLAEGLSIDAELDQMDAGGAAPDGDSFGYAHEDGAPTYQEDPVMRRSPGFVPNLEEEHESTDSNKPFIFNEEFTYDTPYDATDVIEQGNLDEQPTKSKFGEIRFGQGYDLTRETDNKKRRKRR